jgi:hypothetical protein
MPEEQAIKAMEVPTVDEALASEATMLVRQGVLARRPHRARGHQAMRQQQRHHSQRERALLS